MIKKQMDHATPPVTIGHIYIVLRCGLTILLIAIVVITRGQSHLTKRAHRSHTLTVQWYSPGGANVHPPNNASLGPPKSTTQMASRSVQPFMHSSRQRVAIFYNGPHLSLITASSHGGSEPSSNTWFRRPNRVNDPSSISIS